MWIIIKSSSSTHVKWDPWWVSLADGQVSFLTKIESVSIHGMFLYQYRLYFSKERNLPAGQRYPPWGPLEMSKRRRFSPTYPHFLGGKIPYPSTQHLKRMCDDLFFFKVELKWVFRIHPTRICGQVVDAIQIKLGPLFPPCGLTWMTLPFWP